MIRAIFGVGGLTLAFFALTVISMAMFAGVTVAYQVDDPDNSTIAFNGTHLQIGPESAEVMPPEDKAWSEYEPEHASEPPEDDMYVLEEHDLFVELSADMDDPFEDTLVETALDQSVGELVRSMMHIAFSGVGVLGNHYADFFFEHRSWIPEYLATAYVATYTLSAWGLFAWVKVNGARKVFGP